MSEYANELLMELSQFAQEMAVEACEIRILHKILIKNKYLSASVYFCPGISLICLDYSPYSSITDINRESPFDM